MTLQIFPVKAQSGYFNANSFEHLIKVVPRTALLLSWYYIRVI